MSLWQRLFGGPNKSESPVEHDGDEISRHVRALHGNDIEAAMEGATRLGEGQDPRAVPALLRLFQRDDCFGGRAARMDSCGPWLRAAESLGRIGDPAAIEPLARIVESSQTTDMIYAGGLALARLGDGRGIRRFLQLMADPDWEYSTRTIGYKLRRILEEAPCRIPESDLHDLANLPDRECYDSSTDRNAPIEDCARVRHLALVELERRRTDELSASPAPPAST